MDFIDILIILFAGIYLLISGEKLLKPTDPSFEKKKRSLKQLAYGFIIISVVYFIINVFL